MKKLILITATVFLLQICLAQFTVLHQFNGNDGQAPLGNVIQRDSTIFGMTFLGGSNGLGTIFSISKSGNDFKLLHEFESAGNDGIVPFGSLLLSDSVLFGMTSCDMANGDSGTIFRINPDGTGFKVIHKFKGGVNNGAVPYNSLNQINDTLYGTTSCGGKYGSGTIFQVTTDGSNFKILHSFKGGINDGESPRCNLLHYDQFLFGTSYKGGSSNLGTIFRINLNGSEFKLLYSFSGEKNEGDSPYFTSLIQSGSSLYGMTSSYNRDYPIDGGAIFKIDTNGNDFQVLHHFEGGEDDGWLPYGSLIKSGSTFYGMTCGQNSPKNNGGVIFQIKDDGTGFEILHRFPASSAGTQYPGYGGPRGSLLLSDSVLYGMTRGGGNSDKGLIFSYNLRNTVTVNIESAEKSTFNIYPNPTKGHITLSLGTSQSRESLVEIYNLQGAPVFSKTFQNTPSATIDLTGKATGIYVVKVIAGGVSYEEKIVKE